MTKLLFQLGRRSLLRSRALVGALPSPVLGLTCRSPFQAHFRERTMLRALATNACFPTLLQGADNSGSNISRRPWLAPCASIFGLKFASRLNSFWRDDLGARSAICIGVLVMGIEHRPRSKQRRPAEPSLRVDENSDDMLAA